MHIWQHKWSRAAQPASSAARPVRTNNAGILLALSASLTVSAGLAGCASPGPPLPPSLKLPQVVAPTALTATRVGDAVTLHWTTPMRTTDKLLIAGPITAVICRNLPPAAQDDIARVVLRLTGNDDEEPPVALSSDERAAVAASKAAAARGEFATDEQARAVWAKHGL